MKQLTLEKWRRAGGCVLFELPWRILDIVNSLEVDLCIWGENPPPPSLGTGYMGNIWDPLTVLRMWGFPVGSFPPFFTFGDLIPDGANIGPDVARSGILEYLLG
ncbi:hypothetical protein AVEN_170295-1 [Araneus ventricosus]|uniref:Uncharacterized protein n=1 Tax=Araneus ventricosus TaxID=182803 RepID=A0A4Y2W516_ARAVE|nr:hypothetical protein AVEN_17979-1 [Araneus ventricosus]GBO34658.1 hypothetical protein AVEN_170295-1 [Araneus ventricosus]